MKFNSSAHVRKLDSSTHATNSLSGFSKRRWNRCTMSWQRLQDFPTYFLCSSVLCMNRYTLHLVDWKAVSCILIFTRTPSTLGMNQPDFSVNSSIVQYLPGRRYMSGLSLWCEGKAYKIIGKERWGRGWSQRKCFRICASHFHIYAMVQCLWIMISKLATSLCFQYGYNFHAVIQRRMHQVLWATSIWLACETTFEFFSTWIKLVAMQSKHSCSGSKLKCYWPAVISKVKHLFTSPLPLGWSALGL